MTTPLGPEDNDAAHDEGNGDRHGMEQSVLDLSPEQQPQYGERQEGNCEVEKEALRVRLVAHLADRLREAVTIFPAYRQYRAHLDDDREHVRAFPVEPE